MLPVFLQELPPYNGYGLVEDSAQNCFALVPKAPKKDVMKMLMNDNKVLRYLAALVRIIFIYYDSVVSVPCTVDCFVYNYVFT